MTCAPSAVRRSLALLTACLFSAAAFVAQAAPPARAASSPLSGVQLPVTAQDVTDTDTNLGSAAHEVVVARQGDDGPAITKVRANSSEDADRLAASLNRLPGVTAARNRVYRLPAPAADLEAHGLTAAPRGRAGARLRIEDEEYGADEWGLFATGAEDAWTITRGAGILVAVIDSGVDPNHPDLVGRLLPQVDVVPGPSTDVTGHGTHVAGIIAASLNGTGTVGLANKSRVLPIRVFDASGAGDTASVASGVNEAVRRKVQVINLSLGGNRPDPVLGRAIAHAISAGVTVVAAAGNQYEDGNPTTYPASFPGVVGVGSVGYDFRRSPFSNTGSYVDLAAPGENIRSTYPGPSWEWASGTSMAAPFVSAAAALVRAANPTLSGPSVSSVLFSTSWDDESGDGRDPQLGHGVVRADGAASKAARLPGGIKGPAIAARVSARRGGYGNLLRVDVNPSKADVRAYTFRLQQRSADGVWVLLPGRYRTAGSGETKTLRLAPGRYRVVVNAGRGYTSAISTPVTITVSTARVRAKATAKGSRLYVDVDPNAVKGTWSFQVQRRSQAGRWVTKGTYRTKGAASTRSLDLPPGSYRVVVRSAHGMRGAISVPVKLVS